MTSPGRLPGPDTQRAIKAADIVAGRIFLLDSPRHADRVPPFLSSDRSGLVLCGSGGHTRAGQLWRQSAGPLLIDPGSYTDQLATAGDPFSLPDGQDALIGVDLDVVLTGQRQCHSVASITPSGYVQAGDSDAFKALVRRAQDIERDDVIVAVPVALPWLTQSQYLPQLIAGLPAHPASQSDHVRRPEEPV